VAAGWGDVEIAAFQVHQKAKGKERERQRERQRDRRAKRRRRKIGGRNFARVIVARRLNLSFVPVCRAQCRVSVLVLVC